MRRIMSRKLAILWGQGTLAVLTHVVIIVIIGVLLGIGGHIAHEIWKGLGL